MPALGIFQIGSGEPRLGLLVTRILLLAGLFFTVFFVFKSPFLASLVISGYQAPLSNIQKIEFASSRFSYSIELIEGRFEPLWILKTPEQAPISHEFITELFAVFENFQFGEALQLVDSEAVGYMPSKPEATLIVSSSSGESFSILFGRRNEYLARRYIMVGSEQAIYAPPDVLMPLLDRDPAELRQMNPLAFLADKLLSVAYSSGVVLTKTPSSDWLANGMRADQPFAREYLRRLVELQVLGYESGPVEKGDKLLSIDITFESDGMRQIGLNIFQSIDEHLAFLQTSELPVTMKIERSQIKRLKPSLEVLQTTQNLDFPAEH